MSSSSPSDPAEAGAAPAARTVRLVHTSDLHLGDPLTDRESMHALSVVVDTARDVGADALLLAGDLFDHPHVEDALMEWFIGELARFGGDSFVLPGNHDAFDGRSVYRRAAFEARPSFVHLVGIHDDPRHKIAHLGIEVVGRATVEHVPSFRPLANLPPRTGGQPRIAMGHGRFVYEEFREAEAHRASPILPEDVSACDADYVALGHWNTAADVSRGGVPAFYSGAPHDRDGLAKILSVTITSRDGARATVSVESIDLATTARERVA